MSHSCGCWHGHRLLRREIRQNPASRIQRPTRVHWHLKSDSTGFRNSATVVHRKRFARLLRGRSTHRCEHKGSTFKMWKAKQVFVFIAYLKYAILLPRFIERPVRFRTLRLAAFLENKILLIVLVKQHKTQTVSIIQPTCSQVTSSCHSVVVSSAIRAVSSESLCSASLINPLLMHDRFISAKYFWRCSCRIGSWRDGNLNAQQWNECVSQASRRCWWKNYKNL